MAPSDSRGRKALMSPRSHVAGAESFRSSATSFRFEKNRETRAAAGPWWTLQLSIILLFFLLLFVLPTREMSERRRERRPMCPTSTLRRTAAVGRVPASVQSRARVPCRRGMTVVMMGTMPTPCRHSAVARLLSRRRRHALRRLVSICPCGSSCDNHSQDFPAQSSLARQLNY